MTQIDWCKIPCTHQRLLLVRAGVKCNLQDPMLRLAHRAVVK